MLNTMFAADAIDHRSKDEIASLQLMCHRRESIHGCLPQLWSVIQRPQQRMYNA